jgi:ribulose-phosphate 3-epimerase
MIKISASILSANFADLNNMIARLEQAGADMIHIDIMDGHFVPDLTFGPLIIQAIRSMTNLTLDVHLMIRSPENSIRKYVASGADIITIHPESTTHLDRTIDIIKSLNCKIGIALLPTTLPDVLDYVMDKIDLILIMTVNPGFSGQKFILSQLDKIKIVSAKIKFLQRYIMLSVDGGINDLTAKLCIESGADILVSGSFILQNTNYRDNILKLRY